MILTHHRRLALIDRKKRRVEELRREIAREEIKLLVPSLNCSEPELVEKCRKDRIQALRRELRIEQLELEDLQRPLEQNLELNFA